MATLELSARLRYLNESAHLLALTAPETSRHLMSVVNSQLLENNLEASESHRREVCGACGTIMTVLSGAKITIEPRQPLPQRRRRKRKHGEVQTTSRREKMLAYTCGACGRYTRHELGVLTPRKRAPGSKSNLEDVPKQPARAEQMKTEPSVNKAPTTASTSKKRAKSRKNLGLEAILARQKAAETTSSGFGLDLMDFMKKP